MAKKGEHKTRCKRGHLRTSKSLYKDGSCRICVKMMCKRWADANPRPEYLMWNNARKRAKRHGVPFRITTADISIPKFCPILGIRLRHAKGMGPADYSPSLDRIKPKRGYVRRNIAVISNLANKIKSSATAAQVHKVALWMRRAGC